jgi:hypothetical protein
VPRLFTASALRAVRSCGALTSRTRIQILTTHPYLHTCTRARSPAPSPTHPHNVGVDGRCATGRTGLGSSLGHVGKTATATESPAHFHAHSCGGSGSSNSKSSLGTGSLGLRGISPRLAGTHPGRLPLPSTIAARGVPLVVSQGKIGTLRGLTDVTHCIPRWRMRG